MLWKDQLWGLTCATKEALLISCHCSKRRKEGFAGERSLSHTAEHSNPFYWITSDFLSCHHNTICKEGIKTFLQNRELKQVKICAKLKISNHLYWECTCCFQRHQRQRFCCCWQNTGILKGMTLFVTTLCLYFFHAESQHPFLFICYLAGNVILGFYSGL